MFIPSHFRVSDSDEVDRFIAANSFGVLISLQEGKFIGSHLPILRLGDTHLQAHVARANPQWQELQDQPVLLILPGPHDYVSPGWYDSPGVPTWNYQAVHIYATASCFTDVEKLNDLVIGLSRRHEASREVPWHEHFDPGMLNAIVGIDLKIDEIQCKYKLSQNRSRQDQLNVMTQLEAAGNTDLSRAMQQHNKLA